METIKDSRENWYLAYKQGNTVELKKHESHALIVEVNGKQEESDRYAEISKKVQANTWFQPELSRQEYFEETGCSCMVSGKAEIIEGKAKGKLISYSEIWQLVGSNWQLVHLEINAND